MVLNSVLASRDLLSQRGFVSFQLCLGFTTQPCHAAVLVSMNSPQAHLDPFSCLTKTTTFYYLQTLNCFLTKMYLVVT